MVVVVILNYNDADNCLRVANNALKDSNINKVIIVDNCSPDKSYERLKEHASDNLVIMQSERNGGFAYGHNVGIRYALTSYDPDVLITINSDIVVENNVLDKLIEFLRKNDEYGLVSCAIREKDGKLSALSYWTFPSYKELCLRCSWIYRKFKKKEHDNLITDSLNEYMDVDAVRGSLMCFRGKALKDVNAFDVHTFLYFEENIMGKKLQKAGYKVGFLSKIEYFHNHKENNGIRYVDIRPSLKSGYYYATAYGNVTGVKKAILWICTNVGILEQDIVTTIKRCRKM